MVAYTPGHTLKMADTKGDVLLGEFISGTEAFSVTLDDNQISWIPSIPRKGVEAITVPLQDVIAVQALEDLKNQGSGYRLHYSLLADNHVRKPAILDFRSRDQGLTLSWTDELKKRHRSATSNRPQRLLVYINPVSGAGKAGDIYHKHVAPVFELAGVVTEVLVSTHSGYIRDHVMETDLSKFDGIVVVGGDGTFSEMTSGLLLRKLRTSGVSDDDSNMALCLTDIPAGLIPAGTGQWNSVRFYNSRDPTTAALSILQGVCYSIDAFVVHDDSRFVGLGNLQFCFGMFSHILETSEANRRWLGSYRYIWGLIKWVYYMPKYECEVEITRASETADSDARPDDSVPPGVASFNGEIFDVLGTTFDALKRCDDAGVMKLDVIKSQATRGEYVKYLSTFQIKSDGKDFPYVNDYRASKFGVKPTRSPDNDSIPSPHVVHSSVAIDGDLYPVSGEWIQVRNFARVIRIFIAQRHGGTDDNHLEFV